MTTLEQIKTWVKDLFHVWELEIYYNAGEGAYGIRKVKRKLFPRKDGWRCYDDTGTRSMAVPYRWMNTLEAQWLTMKDCHKHNGRGLKND